MIDFGRPNMQYAVVALYEPASHDAVAFDGQQTSVVNKADYMIFVKFPIGNSNQG
jgi:hypothetical protein